MDVAIFYIDAHAGVILTGYLVCYFAVTLSLYFRNKPVIMNELISFATEYGQIQKRLLREMDLPYALLDDSGKVIWTNAAFEAVTHQPKGYKKSITSCSPPSPGTACRMPTGWTKPNMTWNTRGTSMWPSSRRFP